MTETAFGSALSRLWPRGNQKIPGLIAGMIDTAPGVFSTYNIDSPLLVAHLMGQFSEECGCGLDVVENGNYSAVRMTQVWPNRFPTVESARPYAGNAEALFNKVYGGRMGNVNPGDGFRFRGRGASQCTGREGYQKLGRATGLDLVNNPDLINNPKHFLRCAVVDWIICGCLPFAKADDILGETKKLNGGTVGLADRRTWIGYWKVMLAQYTHLPLYVPAGSIDVIPPVVGAPTVTPAPEKPNVPSVTNPAPGSIGAFFASLLSLLFRKKG
jgi:putative chitinase